MALLFSQILTHYSAYYTDQIEYKQNIRYSTQKQKQIATDN